MKINASIRYLVVLVLAGTCLSGSGQVVSSSCIQTSNAGHVQVADEDDGWQERPFKELEHLFDVQAASGNTHTDHMSRATGDITILASAGFLIYKTFLSSQDRPSCIFTPSCSEYAMQSIEKKGLFLGWMSAFDRLSRCHGLVNHRHYPFDQAKQRFYDPVD